MRECGWIRDVQSENGNTAREESIVQYPEPTPSQLKTWAALIKRQEAQMIARRRNAGNVTEQVVSELK